jgi:hypothetical protein
MNRRQALRLGAASLLPMLVSKGGPTGSFIGPASATSSGPTAEDWGALAARVGGRLRPVQWPIQACIDAPSSKETAAFFRSAKNPYFLGDHPGLTQSFGWVGAWYTRPSAFVLAAETTADIVEAVRFARRHGLRLVIKGGGHSYHGASNAPDSLLVWTRNMAKIDVHERFTPAGSAGRAAVPAVSVEAGAIWGQVYREVTVRSGRYVQGGGCLTVGAVGLVQGGGFGSFSKAFGLAAASLLEAEVVTADGSVRIVNEYSHPDLFFALKGGGGGTFGIVTRMTLQTHELPETFGAVFAEIRAPSDENYRALIDRIVSFYAADLHNPHWGEQLSFRPGNVLAISMVFQGLNQAEAERAWASFFDWVRARPEAFQVSAPPTILAVPARSFWDPEFLKSLPGIVLADDQPGAAKDRVFWASNQEEAGQIIHAYQSAWVPAELLANGRRQELVEALYAASRHWSVTLHMNKGLAGAPMQVREAALRTAMNPAVVDSFALAICGAEGPAAYPGVRGREPDLAEAHRQAGLVARAMSAFRARIPSRGAYLYESDYFEKDWANAYWGANYPMLLAAKDKYDPERFFNVHHGVGTRDAP